MIIYSDMMQKAKADDLRKALTYMGERTTDTFPVTGSRAGKVSHTEYQTMNIWQVGVVVGVAGLDQYEILDRIEQASRLIDSLVCHRSSFKEYLTAKRSA